MDQDIPYNGYPDGASYGGYPSNAFIGNEHMVYDGFFPDRQVRAAPSLLDACIDASTSNMPKIRNGRLCSRDDDGLWHIWGIAK